MNEITQLLHIDPLLLQALREVCDGESNYDSGHHV